MRVALLTRAIPSANAFVRRLEAVAELVLVVVEAPRPSSPRPIVEAPALLERLRPERLGPKLRPGAHRALDRVLDRVLPSGEVKAREARAIARVYGDRARPIAPATPLLTIEHRAFASALPELRRAAPDLLAVFGTSWVPEEVTAVARLAAINVHAGLAPHYRGNRCVEHALLASDVENVGVTLHLVRPELDAGELVAQRRPALEPTDDEHVVAHRVLDVGQAAFAELVRALDAGARLAPKPQPRDVGTYFPVGAYTSGHARLLRELIEGGLVARHLERAAAGRTRAKPIFEALQVEVTA